MMSFDDITGLFSVDLQGKYCIEIEFLVKGYPEYQSCWMGKTPDKTDKERELYWYGLVPDGSQAYDYNNFRDFSSAPVFEGQSLKEVWYHIEVMAIDGCDPEERIQVYLKSL